VTFTITDMSGDAVSCDGGDNTVALSDSARAICTVSSGLTSRESPYMVTANYNGDGTFRSSTSSASVDVSG
jgi:hypothetical protein